MSADDTPESGRPERSSACRDITAVLRQLHWLLVLQRITLSWLCCMLTYKCLHGLAPSYLADVCVPVLSVVRMWQLRSADSGTLVPRTRTTIGRRDFAMSSSATWKWNSLSVELRTSVSLYRLQRRDSTHSQHKTAELSQRRPRDAPNIWLP